MESTLSAERAVGEGSVGQLRDSPRPIPTSDTLSQLKDKGHRETGDGLSRFTYSTLYAVTMAHNLRINNLFDVAGRWVAITGAGKLSPYWSVI
jgi:hypothetical protein